MNNSEKAMKVMLGVAMTSLITGIIIMSEKTIVDEGLIGLAGFIIITAILIQINE